VLVEDALAEYNKHKPIDKIYNLELVSPRQYNWDLHLDPIFNRSPDWISECTPMKYGAVSISSFYMQNYYNQESQYLINPTEAPWDYTKPLLTVPFSSRYKIIAVYNHTIEQVMDDQGLPTNDWEIKSISSKDTHLLKLIQAYFLQGIGRSRKAFTLNDLPIIMDADAIAAEGNELEEKTLEGLRNSSKFHLSMG